MKTIIFFKRKILLLYKVRIKSACDSMRSHIFIKRYLNVVKHVVLTEPVVVADFLLWSHMHIFFHRSKHRNSIASTIRMRGDGDKKIKIINTYVKDND